MGYICKDCGSEERFRGRRDYTAYQTEEIYFDSSGEVQDYGDTDTHDGEAGDWHDGFECMACGSENIENTDDEEELQEIRDSVVKKEEESKKVSSWKEKIGVRK